MLIYIRRIKHLILKYPMSKKRDKKTPMFVSNINSNYQFVDYTGPGELGPGQPSSFGNPNLVPPSQPTQQPNRTAAQPQAMGSPKKQNNWFEQMLQSQQNKNIQSPTGSKTGISEVARQSPTNQVGKQNNAVSFGQPNQNYNQPFQSLGQNNPPFQSNYNSNFNFNSNFNSNAQNQNPQPSFKKQVNPPTNQYMATQSPIKPSQGFQQIITSPNNSNNFNNNYQNVSVQPQQPPQPPPQQPKPYQFKTATVTTTVEQKSYQSNNYGFNQNQNVNLNQQPQSVQPPPQQPQKQAPIQNKYSYSSQNKYQTNYSSVPTQSSSTSYKTTSTSTSSGFTDQSIAQYLPQPARSNILAMIRRNKANN